MYQGGDACAKCSAMLPEVAPGATIVEGQRQLVITSAVKTRALMIAIWLYKKGYKGFQWKSKEEYDESGPWVSIRKCW
jgi:hypothetical protein